MKIFFTFLPGILADFFRKYLFSQKLSWKYLGFHYRAAAQENFLYYREMALGDFRQDCRRVKGLRKNEISPKNHQISHFRENVKTNIFVGTQGVGR